MAKPKSVMTARRSPEGAADEHDVAGLEVAVDHAVRMRGVESADDLLQEVEGERGLDGAIMANVFGQRMAVEELHAQEPDLDSGRRHIAEELVDAADVWMGDGARLLYLAAKSLDHCITLCEVGADRLDGNSLAKFRVPRLVDFAHAAACDEAMNLKPAADGGSWFEGRGRFLCRRVGTRQKRGFEEVSGLLVGEQKHLHEMTNFRGVGAGAVQKGAALLGGLGKSCLKEILDEILRVGHCFHPAPGRMQTNFCIGCDPWSDRSQGLPSAGSKPGAGSG